MQLQPVQNYILCSIHEGKSLEAGIVLPDGAELQPYAKVTLCGPDCKLTKIGDLVLFNPSNALFADTINSLRYVIVPESCVFAKYTEPTPQN